MTPGWIHGAGVFREALARREARWEALCRQCGLCCYEKERRERMAPGGRRRREVVTDFRKPCRYLDISSRRCTVYAERFHACRECRRMTVRHALFVKWLPPRCGYVQRYRPGAGARAHQPTVLPEP